MQAKEVKSKSKMKQSTLTRKSIGWQPLYSICISNYNMEDTIRDSIESICGQIDERFEVVIVDDGSSDESLSILEILGSEHYNIRIIPLARDKRRKLGETRNISIRAARGKYCILHIECDDKWDDFIRTFTKIYHEIEKRTNISDFMLSGSQIQMATKRILQSVPYRNIYYVEDRLLWSEMTVRGKLISVGHRIMRVRMENRGKKRKLVKIIAWMYSSMTVAFGITPSRRKVLGIYLRDVLNLRGGSNLLPKLLKGFLIPITLIRGGLLRRQKIIAQALGTYRKDTMICLQRLEDETSSEHGLFDLSEAERKLFRLDSVAEKAKT